MADIKNISIFATPKTLANLLKNTGIWKFEKFFLYLQKETITITQKSSNMRPTIKSIKKALENVGTMTEKEVEDWFDIENTEHCRLTKIGNDCGIYLLYSMNKVWFGYDIPTAEYILETFDFINAD